MDQEKKKGRYGRIYTQLEALTAKCDNPLSRMATVAAVLHHKMEYFFWTGFYMINNGRLLVGPYQGPVACQELAFNTGVCWAGIKEEKPIVVPDVNLFPGHIACDSRSKSEIVVPVINKYKKIMGVLDVDSKDPNSFDEIDAVELEKIVNLIFR